MTDVKETVLDVLVGKDILTVDQFTDVIDTVRKNIEELGLTEDGGLGPFLRSMQGKIEEAHYENLMSRGEAGFATLTAALAIMFETVYNKGYRLGTAEETVTVDNPIASGSEGSKGDEIILPV